MTAETKVSTLLIPKYVVEHDTWLGSSTSDFHDQLPEDPDCSY